MIYKYISQLANMQRRCIDRLAGGKAYSGTEGKIMHYLFMNTGRPVFQKNIEEVFGLRAASATQAVSALERSGLVRRQQSAEDGRYKELVLTPKADAHRQEIFSDMDALEKQIVRGIAPEKLELWREITGIMIENLKGN